MDTKIPGRRRDAAIAPHLYEPGDYGRHDGAWYAMVPLGYLANLGRHIVIEHDDGTISVSPSILVSGRHDEPSWHGYLERGAWREC